MLIIKKYHIGDGTLQQLNLNIPNMQFKWEELKIPKG
jgi:hypothetical protein